MQPQEVQQVLKRGKRSIRLVPPGELRPLWRALGFLDALLQPDWEMRQYSFDPRWARGEEVGFRRNGEGDHAEAWFSSHGVVLRGFLLDSPMSPLRRGGRPWPGLLRGLPSRLREAVEEPAFGPDELTLCLWAPPGATRWQHSRAEPPRDVEDPDGAAYLLELLDGDPRKYVAYALRYFDRQLTVAEVRSVYRAARSGEPLDPERIESRTAPAGRADARRRRQDRRSDVVNTLPFEVSRDGLVIHER